MAEARAGRCRNRHVVVALASYEDARHFPSRFRPLRRNALYQTGISMAHINSGVFTCALLDLFRQADTSMAMGCRRWSAMVPLKIAA
jgi:hypothetical protein